LYRRTQASVIDFIVAFFIFASIFLVNHQAWNSIETKLENTESTHFFKTSIYNIVETLIKTNGEPFNWEENPGSLISIGLADKENILSNEKLVALNNTDYNLTRNQLGNYQITIQNDSDTIYRTGATPNGSIVRVERIIKINNSYYSFIFKGWWS
jgi:hypothetical protein